MPPKKLKYTSRSVERHVGATRQATWGALLEVLARGPSPFGDESVLSFEAPWRRSAAFDSATLDTLQVTYVLRDDVTECHIAAAIVVDPEPTPDGQRTLDEVVALVGELLDVVVDEAP